MKCSKGFKKVANESAKQQQQAPKQEGDDGDSKSISQGEGRDAQRDGADDAQRD